MYTEVLTICLLFLGIHIVCAQKCLVQMDSMESTTYYYLLNGYNKFTNPTLSS